jgi:hypothetical protein
MKEIESLAMRGWRLLPCAARGKAALLKGWPALASSDVATIREWAAQFQECNWGIATGPGSRVFVLDVDGAEGSDSLAVLESKHGPLPLTLTSLTGRGEHRWFNYPTSCEVRGSAGKLGRGLDVRGAGGYVIVPPSIHESRRPYQWIDPEQEIEDAPRWLFDLLSGSNRPTGTSHATRIFFLFEGHRNDTLFRFGCAMRRRGATQDEIERSLLQKNECECRPPLEAREICRIAVSAARYEPGGPDPLETAWEIVLSETNANGYVRFLALARCLQLARPGLLIALPLKRIGDLMERDWTQVRRWRKRAVRDGWLHLKEHYIPHVKAALYEFNEIPASTVPLRQDDPLSNTH